jgi:hypothetical protein
MAAPLQTMSAPNAAIVGSASAGTHYLLRGNGIYTSRLHVEKGTILFCKFIGFNPTLVDSIDHVLVRPQLTGAVNLIEHYKLSGLLKDRDKIPPTFEPYIRHLPVMGNETDKNPALGLRALFPLDEWPIVEDDDDLALAPLGQELLKGLTLEPGKLEVPPPLCSPARAVCVVPCVVCSHHAAVCRRGGDERSTETRTGKGEGSASTGSTARSTATSRWPPTAA